MKTDNEEIGKLAGDMFEINEAIEGAIGVLNVTVMAMDHAGGVSYDYASALRGIVKILNNVVETGADIQDALEHMKKEAGNVQ